MTYSELLVPSGSVLVERGRRVLLSLHVALLLLGNDLGVVAVSVRAGGKDSTEEEGEDDDDQGCLGWT